MAWNGAGTFSLNPLYTPEVNGTTIDAARYNGALTDIATGINTALAKNGQNVPTANLSMGGFKHTNAAAATVAGEYVEYAQVIALIEEATVGVTPLVVTEYSTGGASGTHTFDALATRFRVVLVAGGGGGAGGGAGPSTATASGGGGGGAETIDMEITKFGASMTYDVGAGGTGGAGNAAGIAGGRTRLGTLLAQGGRGGGLAAGGAGGGIDATPTHSSGFSVPGGGGGTPSSSGTAAAHGGRAPGYPAINPANTDQGNLISSGGANAGAENSGGGGSSCYGTGGNGGATANGSAGTGYGGGGGGGGAGPTRSGGAGSAGYIRIEEYA